jgi:hypothetical protein
LRVPKATRLIVVTLSGFFGPDGGILGSGFGVVNPKAATTPRLAGIRWSIDPAQVYRKRVPGLSVKETASGSTRAKYPPR